MSLKTCVHFRLGLASPGSIAPINIDTVDSDVALKVPRPVVFEHGVQSLYSKTKGGVDASCKLHLWQLLDPARGYHIIERGPMIIVDNTPEMEVTAQQQSTPEF